MMTHKKKSYVYCEFDKCVVAERKAAWTRLDRKSRPQSTALEDNIGESVLQGMYAQQHVSSHATVHGPFLASIYARATSYMQNPYPGAKKIEAVSRSKIGSGALIYYSFDMVF